jgi:uncharacterized lipoprotein YajG
MKSLFIVVSVAALAGCASYGDEQYAKAECKVVPMTTASATGVRTSRVDSLASKDAQLQASTSEYRRREYAARGMVNNNIEEALRDCY